MGTRKGKPRISLTLKREVMNVKIRNCTCGRKAEISSESGLGYEVYFVVCTRQVGILRTCWIGSTKRSKAQAIEVWNWTMKAIDHRKGK